MKPDREGFHLWSIVAATVRPFPGRNPPPLGEATWAEAGAEGGRRQKGVNPDQHPLPFRLPSEPLAPKRGQIKQSRPPDPIEPGRFHRLARGRAPSAPAVDLHNLNQDRARSALTAFILRAHAEGERAVLVITGKGALGDGILRRRTPEWLAEPPLRALVAGVSEAHAKHGGAGALYVALKRR